MRLAVKSVRRAPRMTASPAVRERPIGLSRTPADRTPGEAMRLAEKSVRRARG